MPIYRVRLNLVEYSSAEVEVSANSPDEAEAKAKDELLDEDYSRHDAEETTECIEEIENDKVIRRIEYV